MAVDPAERTCLARRYQSPEESCQANLEGHVAPDWTSFFDSVEKFLGELGDSSRFQS